MSAMSYSRHLPGTTEGVPTVATEAASLSPSSQQPGTLGLQAIRQSYELAGVLPEVAEFLTCSWRMGTQQQYEVYIKQWVGFCCGRETSVFSPHLSEVLEFLLQLLKQWLS